MRRILETLVGSLIIAAVTYQLWLQRGFLRGALALSWQEFVGFTVWILVGWCANALQFCCLWRAEGLRVGAWESFLTVAGSTLGNYSPARAGTALRFHYLLRVHDFPYTRSSGLLGSHTLLMLLSSGLVGGVGCFMAWMSGGEVSWQLFVLFAAATIACLVVAIRGLPLPAARTGRVWTAYKEAAASFMRIRSRPGMTVLVVLLALIQFGALGWRFNLAYGTLGSQLSVSGAVIIAAAMVLAGLVSLTPGSLGLREAFAGYVAYSLGTGFNRGLLAATVDRAVLVLLTVLVGGCSFVWMWLRIRGQGSATEPRTAGKAECS